MKPLDTNTADLARPDGRLPMPTHSSVPLVLAARPTCAVRGAITRGAMCGNYFVGGGCGFSGECQHKQEPGAVRPAEVLS